MTVRTLHHYDRIGLLKPRRTRAGHRLYSPRHLESLQQIHALKLVGVPLKRVALLRQASAAELARVLREQRARLEEKRQRTGALIAAIREVERVLERDGAASPEAFARIIKVMDMQTEDDEWAAVVRATSAYRRSLRPEVLAELGRQHELLLADVQGLLDDEPTSPRAQAMTARWTALVRAMNGPDVPLETLLRCGRATYHEIVHRKPQLAASPWGRSVSLLSRAAELQR